MGAELLGLAEPGEKSAEDGARPLPHSASAALRQHNNVGHVGYALRSAKSCWNSTRRAPMSGILFPAATVSTAIVQCRPKLFAETRSEMLDAAHGDIRESDELFGFGCLTSRISAWEH